MVQIQLIIFNHCVTRAIKSKLQMNDNHSQIREGGGEKFNAFAEMTAPLTTFLRERN